MRKFFSAVKKFALDEEGVTAIEYGLIAALVAVVVAGTVTTLGVNMKAIFNKIALMLVVPTT